MAAYVQDTIMLFGDSITQGGWEDGLDGFGQRLSHAYSRKLDVISRGLAGYNTDWAIPVFEQCFATREEQQHIPRVRLLTIWFGANDASIKPSPQHVPLSKYVSNLKHIIGMVKSPESPRYSPHTQIILMTPPPVSTILWTSFLASRSPPTELDRLFETTKAYAQAVKDVAAEENIPVVDTWTDIWKATGESEQGLDKYLTDGLHLSAEGYKVVYEGLIKVIKENYPELYHENLQPVFTLWNDINYENPAASLVKRKAEVDG